MGQPVAAHSDHLYIHPKHFCQSLDIFLCCCQLSSSSPLVFSNWIKNVVPAVKTGEAAYFQKHEGSYYYDMSSVWKKMTVIKRIEGMYVIVRFTVGLCGKNNMFFPHSFFPS